MLEKYCDVKDMEILFAKVITIIISRIGCFTCRNFQSQIYAQNNDNR